MPQEFHVLKCYSCYTFQVHIVKKSNKWSCKMCGEKQSLKKVYAVGAAKDCRKHVQSLNEKRMLNDLNQSTDNEPNINYEPDKVIYESTLNNVEPNQSKWSEYLTTENEINLPEPDCDNIEYTFERPSKRMKKSHTTDKKLENEDSNDNKNQIFSKQNLGETIDSNGRQNEEINSKESKWNSFVTESQEDTTSFAINPISPTTNIFDSTNINSLDYILDI